MAAVLDDFAAADNGEFFAIRDGRLHRLVFVNGSNRRAWELVELDFAVAQVVVAGNGRVVAAATDGALFDLRSGRRIAGPPPAAGAPEVAARPEGAPPVPTEADLTKASLSQVTLRSGAVATVGAGRWRAEITRLRGFVGQLFLTTSVQPMTPACRWRADAKSGVSSHPGKDFSLAGPASVMLSSDPPDLSGQVEVAVTRLGAL